MAGVFETIYQKLTGKAISHRPDLASRVHVYSEYSDSKAQPADQADDYYEIYGTYVWARKAISKIAENMRSLPIYVYDRNNEAMEGHLLSQLLQRGNDAMSPSQFWEQYVIYLMLAGEAPIEIVPDGRNRPSEMWLREPQWMYVRPDVSPERIYYPTAAGYVYRPEGKHTAPLEFEPGMVIFDKLFNPSNPWRGIAPIHAVREGITIDLFSQAYSKTFLKNNARPDFAIVAKQLLTEGERDRIETEFLHRHSGHENWHRPAILEDGAEIAPFSFAPKDTEWLEQRRFSRDEVGAIFGVPDEIMGYGRDTYENFQTALETFWTLTLKPLCDHRDDVLNHHFRYRMPLLKPGEYIATDFSSVGVMQDDMTPRVAMAEVLTRMGYDLNAVNERFDLGMPEYTPPAPEPAPVIEQPQVVEVMPKAAVYLPAPVRDAVRGEVNKALEIRQKLLAAGTFDELRWRENAVKALRTWLDASMAVRLADAIATRADVDALLSVAISASQEDGAAEDSPFGEMLTTAGRITPDLWRAAKNTLMLDPEDPEAEQLARMAIERRATREMTRSLEEWLQTALTGLTEDEVRTLASRLRNNQTLFRDVLQRALVQSADLGVSVAVDQFDTVGYGFDYTLANAEARDWARRYTDDLLAQLNTTNERIVGEAVARWVDNGEPLSSLIDDLARSPFFGRQRAELIASTEVTRAYAEANRIAYEQSGVVETLEWRTANDELVCPICGPLGGIAAENVGTEQPKLGGGGNVQTSVRNPQFQHPTNGNVYGVPPAHPRCILPGNEVLPVGPISAMTKSFYVGGCVEVTLRNGSVFSVTENHPVLTPSGWVQAKRLSEGVNVVYAADAERITSSVQPDDNNRPTVVEEMFDAFVESSLVRSVSVPSTTENFHGDGRGINGNIDIVYVDGFLDSSVKSAVGQHLVDSSFNDGGIDDGVLLADSLPNFNIVAESFSADSIMGRCDHCGSLLGASVFPSDIHGIADVARRDAGFDDALSESPSVYTSLGSEFVFRFSSDVALEEIVKIRNYDFSGHVYDLQCDLYELYICNGAIVKNCRCWIVPVIKD